MVMMEFEYTLFYYPFRHYTFLSKSFASCHIHLSGILHIVIYINTRVVLQKMPYDYD